MKSVILLVAFFFLANVFRASAAVTIRFENPKIEVNAEEEFTAALFIDGDDGQAGVQPLANGLFSFAAKIGFDPAQLEVGAEGVFVAPQLNYSGFVPGASIKVEGTNIFIKGNISLDGSAAPYNGTDLAEIVFRNRSQTSSKSTLTISSAQANSNESLIVDGQGNSLDKTIIFQNGEVITSIGDAPTVAIAKRTDRAYSITFSPQAGKDHFLQVSSTLQQWADFQALPINSGQVIVPASATRQFFRLRLAER